MERVSTMPESRSVLAGGSSPPNLADQTRHCSLPTRRSNHSYCFTSFFGDFQAFSPANQRLFQSNRGNLREAHTSPSVPWPCPAIVKGRRCRKTTRKIPAGEKDTSTLPTLKLSFGQPKGSPANPARPRAFPRHQLLFPIGHHRSPLPVSPVFGRKLPELPPLSRNFSAKPSSFGATTNHRTTKVQPSLPDLVDLGGHRIPLLPLLPSPECVPTGIVPPSQGGPSCPHARDQVQLHQIVSGCRCDPPACHLQTEPTTKLDYPCPDCVRLAVLVCLCCLSAHLPCGPVLVCDSVRDPDLAN